MGPKLKIILTTAFLVCPLAAHGQMVEGHAEALTGDTIDLTGTIIKLRGVDAPAADQLCSRKGENWSCGNEAKALLEQLVSGSIVRCQSLMRSDEQSLVGICRTGNIELGEAMVGSGLALANDTEGLDYSGEQERARSLDLGIWGSEFELPAAWRSAHPLAAITERVSAQFPKPVQVAPRVYRNEFGCAIKGNHSRYGDWIYHLPGTRYYNQTRPEDLFCTEEEAIAAGYRRSKAG